MAKKKEECCAFCGRPASHSEVMIPSGISSDIFLCAECADNIHELLNDFRGLDSDGKKKKLPKLDLGKLPKPKDIVAHLDQYVIGQDAAKRYLAVAVYNHYKRLSQPTDDVDIEKSNIVLVGPTGTGKTLLAKTIARMLDVPFTIVDATVLTQAGYVGEDIESLLTRLLQVADYDVARAERGIVFIDEIDKICKRGESSGPDVSREGVQRDLLPLVEGCTVSTKHGMVKTDHILFIASGAFQIAKPSDLIPELQGRLPIRVELQALTTSDFERILTEPNASITVQYKALMATEGVNIEFTDSGIKRIAEAAWQVNESTENIGARRLHTVLERLMEEISYDASDLSGQTITIDADYVSKHLDALVADEDLSRFIL